MPKCTHKRTHSDPVQTCLRVFGILSTWIVAKKRDIALPRNNNLIPTLTGATEPNATAMERILWRTHYMAAVCGSEQQHSSFGKIARSHANWGAHAAHHTWAPNHVFWLPASRCLAWSCWRTYWMGYVRDIIWTSRLKTTYLITIK